MVDRPIDLENSKVISITVKLNCKVSRKGNNLYIILIFLPIEEPIREKH